MARKKLVFFFLHDLTLLTQHVSKLLVILLQYEVIETDHRKREKLNFRLLFLTCETSTLLSLKLANKKRSQMSRQYDSLTVVSQFPKPFVRPATEPARSIHFGDVTETKVASCDLSEKFEALELGEDGLREPYTVRESGEDCSKIEAIFPKPRSSQIPLFSLPIKNTPTIVFLRLGQCLGHSSMVLLAN